MQPSEASRQRVSTRPQDRRRYRRVNVNLPGRFMLEDRLEYPCQTADMSPGSVALVTPVTGRIGERVVAYIDQIGRIEGVIVRNFDGGGFAMTINATPRKKDKLAARLTWLANRQELGLTDERTNERIVPKQPYAPISLPDGREYRAWIIDLSLSGAALGVEVQPPIGSPLMLGTLRAEVVRHLDDGIAVEFAILQTEASLEQAFGSP